MNAFAAASAVAGLLSAPPWVAPRVEAFALADVNPGYALTHRDCATDAPMTRPPAGGFPYTADVPLGLSGSPLFDTRFATRPPRPRGYWGREAWASVPHRYVDGPAPPPAVTRLLRTWDVPAEYRNRVADYYRCGLHAFNRWYNYVGPDDASHRRFPGVFFETEGFILRGLRLSGDATELAALVRDCAASEFPAVRDLGLSLCVPAPPVAAVALRFPFSAGVTPEELNSPFPETRLLLFGPRPARDLWDGSGSAVGQYFWNPPARHDFRAPDLFAAGPTLLLTVPSAAAANAQAVSARRGMNPDHLAEMTRTMRAHAQRLGVLFDDPLLLSAADHEAGRGVK